jgi:hypothetical protein
MQTTSIRSVLPYINSEIVDTDTALEYAYQAYDLIGVKPLYSQESCVLTVDNFKTKLPNDFYRMECLVHVPNYTVVSSEEMSDTNPAKDPDYKYNEEHISRIQSQGIINNYNLYTLPLLGTSQYGIVLRYINSPYSKNVHCTGCPNILSACEYTYTITPGSEIVTNVESGILCIAYLAYAKDENGDLLIPDDAELRSAIAAYVHMKALEMRALNLESETFRLYIEFRNMWQNLAVKVKGNLKIKDLDHVVISNIQERYIQSMKGFLSRLM